jgi:hypothetical protein
MLANYVLPINGVIYMEITMNILELSDDEVIKIATPILGTIIQGTNEKNWDLFTTHISDSMKTEQDRKLIEGQWSKDEFPSNLRSEREFLCIIRKIDCVLILWKTKSKDTKEDFLEMLYLQSQDGDVKVIGTWIK